MASEKPINDMSLEELRRYCFSLERKLDACEKRNEALAARLADVTSDCRWMRGVLENSTMPMREKIALYGSKRALEQKQPREDGLTHVYRSDISKLTGLSDSQVGDALKKLKEKGIIDRKIERHYDKENDRHEQHNLIALGYAAKHNPKAIDFADQSNWGGKREKGNPCGCGCTERVVDRRVTCKQCGSVLDETRKIVGGNELDLEPGEEVF